MAGRSCYRARRNGFDDGAQCAAFGRPGRSSRLLAPASRSQRSVPGPGVMEITLADGRAAYAAVHHLANGLGAVTVIQSSDNVFAQWRAKFAFTVTMFSMTSIVLIVITYAFYTQSTRARDADQIYEEAHSRIETAAETRPMRVVGLGHRPGPHVLVALHVSASGHGRPGRCDRVRRSARSGPSRRRGSIFGRRRGAGIGYFDH